jgi:PTH1 family peptidyl-tRNA hydrolase
MNNSGQAVRALLDFFSISPDQFSAQSADQLYVIHDDLDIELGQFKLQLGTGPKVHNGLDSIYTHLGTKNFWHVRVGVDARQGDRSMPGKNYLLQPFTADQQLVVAETIDQVAAELTHALV